MSWIPRLRGAARRPAPSPEAVRRVLVVKLSSLGDLFHALPAVHTLKVRSGAAIDWVTQPEYADLVRCFTDVDRVIVFPRRQFLKGLAPFWRALREHPYDLVLDMQGLMKSAMPARLARGACVVGPSFRREAASLFYDAVAGPCNKNRHAVEENYDMVRWLGWEETDPQFPVAFPAYAPPGAAPRIAIVPASRWPTKNWAPEKFAALGQGLLEQAGASLYLVGGPAERAACDAMAKGLGDRPGVNNLCGQTSLVELGSLMQAMDLAITVDSGPMHLAAAVGTPVLALFGPTDPARTGPYGAAHRVLGIERLTCRPCFSDACSRADLACMQNLFPSQVLEEALDLLKYGARRAL